MQEYNTKYQIQDNEYNSKNHRSNAIDWDKTFKFGQHFGERMFMAKWTQEHGWKGCMQNYGSIQIMPPCVALNYGQSVFEGLKAYRTQKNRIVFFRPDRNAERLQQSAESFMMPGVPKKMFMEACTLAVRQNIQYVPPLGKGALYLRPLLFGTGINLTLTSSDETTFLIFVTPIGNYYPGKIGMLPTNILVNNFFDRQGENGSGHVKQGGNYAPAFRFTSEAKNQDYADVLFLDVVHHKYIQEQTAANFFMVKQNKVITPPATGAILNGITRRSIIDLVPILGLELIERPVHIDEAMEADECFSCGTAVIISPYKTLTYQNKKRNFIKEGEMPPVAKKIYDTLIGIQEEKVDDKFQWIHEIELR